MEHFPRIQAASDHSVLVVFGRSIGLDAHRSVVRLMRVMQEHRDPFVLNLHPAYSSVLVSFDPLSISHAEVEALLEERIRSLDEVELPASRRVDIQVCYAPEFAPDLPDVAALHGMSIEEVARLHAEPEYRVCFLGFAPGFPYLSGLSPRLATPRLATPRPRVPAGSVAIGGAQTGIYPLESPGGWRIIGRTPLQMLRIEPSVRMRLEMGDVVKFRGIERAEFARITREEP